jgi:integrase
MPGLYNSPESLRGYADFIDRLKAGESLAAAEKPKETPRNLLTIAELIERFWAHCLIYYRGPRGLTGEHLVVRCALRPLLELFGDTLAAEFQIPHLEMVRDEMIRRGWSRIYINKSIGRIKRFFNWAVSKGVPASVSGAIATVKGLEAFRSEARETSEVKPVSDDVIEATLAELSAETGDMVRLARICGCRPSELININVAEIDRRDSECWWYRPACHKTAHRGHKRSIPLNQDAQAILARYILASGAGKLFHFKSRDGLRQSIERACQRAFPHPVLSSIPKRRLTPKQRQELAEWHQAHRWTTNQLRHSALQEAREKDGLDGAQALGGHRCSTTTEVYTSANERRAKEVARKMQTMSAKIG